MGGDRRRKKIVNDRRLYLLVVECAFWTLDEIQVLRDAVLAIVVTKRYHRNYKGYRYITLQSESLPR